MRYNSKDEAQKDHIDNYRSDGILKGKGNRYASDFYRVNTVINHVPENSKVLDVGCNTGVISTRLQRKGCFVKAIDLVKELVELAKLNGVSAEQGEAEDLSRFKNENFDVVICTEVLEHLYDPLPAMREAFRVLKPSGKYLVTVPHPHSCTSKGLGDYHQTNFGIEELDTLFHLLFKRGNVKCLNIPYTLEYCQSNGIDPDQPQWLFIEAIK